MSKSKKTAKPTHWRVRFIKRHKAYMPGDEHNFPGGVAKTLAQLGIAEITIARGETVAPGAGAKAPAKTAAPAETKPKKRSKKKASSKPPTEPTNADTNTGRDHDPGNQ